MQTFNISYGLENAKASHTPIMVFEIMWTSGGTEGVDGVNDIYFGTAAIDKIQGFTHPSRYYPYLDFKSFASISHKVDPIVGVSTLGSVSIDLHDFNGDVGAIIKTAQDAGFGLRRQRVKVFMLYEGMAWADRVKLRTMQVSELRLSSAGKYTLTCVDIQRNMQKTVFNPIKAILTTNVAASGAVTVSLPDNALFIATTNAAYGTSGFIKINKEILQWTGKSLTTGLVVSASGRGMLGTLATAHTAGDDVQEIVVLNENPITMALRVMQSSGVTGQSGAYDTLPAHWGCAMVGGSELDIAGWELLGRDLTGLDAAGSSSSGYQFEFVFDKGFEAKKFVEGDILKALGGFGFVKSDGSYSSKAYSDLSNVDRANAVLHVTINNAVKWSALKYNYKQMANELWLDYVESPTLSGKYIRSAVFIDSVSKKKWGDAKQLKYKMRGVIGTAAYVTALYQRFQRIMARYSRPPLQMNVQLLPREHGVEIGDIVRLDLPINDLLTGVDLDRAFEVIGVNITPKTGAVSIDCIAQPERASFWFGGVGDVATVIISPVNASIAVGGQQQMVLRVYDSGGNQTAAPQHQWAISGAATIDLTGLITGISVGSSSVYAIVGGVNSNAVTINVTASAALGVVARVDVSPSSASLQIGGTQITTAQSFDSSNAIVNGEIYTWASSNPAIASVVAGASASNVITAISNGSVNITATETGSGVVSSVLTAIITPLAPPTFLPPSIADAVYHIGTQLTAADARVTGTQASGYTILSGANFPSGDYWFDGNVTLDTNASCTINGNVRIFSTGNVTIKGHVNGMGRGLAGGAQSSHNRYINAPGGFIWSIADGLPGQGTGLTGVGGNGGNNKGDANAGYVQFNLSSSGGAASGVPVVQIIPITLTNGGYPWTRVSGIPTNMQGAGGGSGGSIAFASAAEHGGAGGAGGAGLLIMARGIFITGSGSVNLSGADGSIGVVAGARPSQCGGGGGGGGSFIGLAEKTNQGLSNMTIDINRITRNGGSGALSSGWYVQRNGMAGGTGFFKPMVIG